MCAQLADFSVYTNSKEPLINLEIEKIWILKIFYYRTYSDNLKAERFYLVIAVLKATVVILILLPCHRLVLYNI